MIPQILLGAALGLLACACSHKQTVPPRTPRRKPDPEPEYRHDFGKDLQAKWIHLELLKRGITDSQLDQGCPNYQYLKPGVTVNKLAVGKGDHSISACEVYELTLNRWEDPKIRPLAERLGGSPLPWSLDDFDPVTQFDQKVRETINVFIQNIAAVLKKQNFKEGTPEYQERMAVALFVAIEMDPGGFNNLMNDPSINSGYKQSYLELKKDMEKLGLTELWERFKSGGLRVLGDYSKEYSALAALQLKYGECTEHSKILYAAFKMAGLAPFFISLKGTDSKHPIIMAQMSSDPNYYHIALGLEINGKTRLFDGALLDIDPPHFKTLKLSLRQYLSLDLNNQANFHRKVGNHEGSLELRKKANLLDPLNDLTYTNAGFNYNKLGEHNKALEVLNAGLEVNPYNGMALTNRAEAFRFLGQHDRALEAYQQAIEVRPDLPNPYLGLGLLYNARGEQEKSIRYYSEGFRVAPYYARNSLLAGLTSTYQEELAKKPRYMTQTLARELGVDPALMLAHFHMITYIYLAGHKNMAMEPVEQLVERTLQAKRNLNIDWSEYSPDTLHTLHNLFEGLPTQMQKEPRVIQLRDALQLPPRPPIPSQSKSN